MRTDISAFLREVYVNHRRIDLESFWSPFETLCNSIARKHGRWITFGDATSIVLARLISGLGETRPPEGARVSLVNLVGADRVAEIENGMATFLEALPHEYHFYCKLGKAQDIASEDVEVTPEARLLSVQIPANFDYLATTDNTVGGLLAGLTESSFKQGDTYVRVTGRGYFSGRHDSSACQSALTLLKQLIGLAESVGALVRTNYQFSEDFSATAVAFDVRSKQAQSFHLPTPFARTLESLTFDAQIFQKPPAGLLGLGRGALAQAGALLQQDEPLARNAWPTQVQERFKRIGNVISRRANDPDTQSLRTAAEWAFDSWAEDNQTLAFLFAAIGIEAVLQGEQQETADTTARLADRLAYLLGKTRQQRSNLQTGFRDFYGVRKGIVHGRSSRLKHDEARWLHWGRDILKGVIAHELKNVPI